MIWDNDNTFDHYARKQCFVQTASSRRQRKAAAAIRRMMRTMSDDLPLSNFISLERADGRARDYGRRRIARLGGYLPPPREEHCPPKPRDRLCECCGRFTTRLHLDHCHETGAFRGWVCNGCNTSFGIMDSVERLEKRIAFLKKAKRIALIKAVHLKCG